MLRVSAGSEEGTTSGAAKVCRTSLPAEKATFLGNILPHSEWFARMGRELWQFKIGSHLECHLGCSDRTARAWASGDNEPPARALALLLRTEDGPRILEWIMRDDPPAWWLAVQQSAATLAQFARR